MKALIDADRLAYAFGGFKDDSGYPLEWALVTERVDSNIANILSATGATSYSVYLTNDDKSNFRIRLATIRPYKGHRSIDKPFWYEQIRRYLVSKYEAKVENGIEADDALGIEQTINNSVCINQSLGGHHHSRSVICSVDKDLDMISGLHYNELKPEKGVYEISEITSYHNFFSQLLTGDACDNIPGLYGIGRASSLLKHLVGISTFSDMYLFVKEQYEKRFGSYYKLFLNENAQLLWILRSYDNKEIIKRFEDAEERTKAKSSSS